MTTRTARSLVTLIDEFNTRFPNRSKASDGTLASSGHHAANPNSDHEAWVKDGSVGVVTAADITEDKEGGFNEIIDWAFGVIIKNRDPRVKYLIHEDRMCRSYDKTYKGKFYPAWTWAPYDGSNPHVKHGHVSVKPEKKFYDSIKPWGLLTHFTDEDIVSLNKVQKANLKLDRAVFAINEAFVLMDDVSLSRTAVHKARDVLTIDRNSLIEHRRDLLPEK